MTRKPERTFARAGRTDQTEPESETVDGDAVMADGGADTAVLAKAAVEPERQAAPRPRAELVALVFILLFAAFLRFKGVDWGENFYLHPDERFQTMVVTRIEWPGGLREYFDSQRSPLNPYNHDFGTYIYGTFPLFVAKLFGSLTGNEVYGNAHLPGRALGGVFDLFSILLVYLIGRRLFGGRTGLLASALLAATVLHVQAAHFFAPDLYVVTFCLAAFYFALRAESESRWWWYLAAGVAAGLATASKINALPIVAVLALPALERVRRSGMRSIIRSPGDGGLSPLLGLGLAIGASVWTFRVAQPYAFLGPNPFSLRFDPRWLNDLRYWREVQSGASDTPPGLQWADRTPVLFGLKNMVLWGMGPLLGLSALAGLLFASFAAVTRRRLPPVWLLFLVGWPAFHLLYYGFAFVQTMRYMLPAYPFLVLLAAAALTRLARHGSRRQWPALPMPRGAALPLGSAPAAVVLIGTVLYALAFSDIYARPTTREAASRWIYENVPADSTIASEHWDDGIPLSFPEFAGRTYQGIQLEHFFVDDEAKLNALLDRLDQADYLVVTSNRLHAVIPRLPERYPMTSEYYELLFSGELGFDLVHEETSYPSLLGIDLVDDGAEEAFTVYDHPRVFVFRKSDSYSRAAIEPPLVAALGGGGTAIGPLDAGFSSLMLDDAARAGQQEGGTWRRMFDADGLTNRAPVLFWYLALQLMALAALPLCWRLFEGLPDRGYAVAKTIGVLLVSYFAWLFASVGAMPFGRMAIGAGITVTAALSVALCWKRRRQLVVDARDRRRLIVATEALFLTVFLLMVWVRMQNPDLWHPSRGGEKPMDFAYFNAVIRSTSFPPFDPWFAGGYLNYYYFGFVQWASVTRLTGIVPEVAYNLAVPAILALLCVNVWSIVVALVHRARPPAERGRVSRSLLGVAVLAPLFVAGLGNLDLARRVGGGEYGYPPSGLADRLPFARSLIEILSGAGKALVHHPPLPDDLYWAATRIVPGGINEFPLFTFLYGDLHAHMMALPISSAALILALQIALSARRAQPDADGDEVGVVSRDALRETREPGWVGRLWDTHNRIVLEAIAAGVLTSALYATNTWDFPTFLAILVGAMLIREGVRAGWTVTYPAAVRVGLTAVGIVIAGRIAFWPFYSQFHTRGGIVRFHERTALDDFLVIHGMLLFAIGGYLVLQLTRSGHRAGAPPDSSHMRPLLAAQPGFVMEWSRALSGTGPLQGLAIVPVAGSGAAVLLIAAGTVIGSLPLFLLGALALVATVAWTQRDEPSRLFVALITAVALGLALAVEFVALKGDIGRMNTVFKFYLQIWLLLGVAAAAAVTLVVMDRSLRRRPGSGLLGLMLAALVLAAAVYPLLAGPARVGDRYSALPPTLDGMAYMQTAVYGDHPEGRAQVQFPLAGDAAAITWLRENVDGSPVVLEASIPGYRWGSRVSVYTGLPTVLGWDWHQIQQRPGFGEMVRDRQGDIVRMLGETGSFESIRPLLDRYGVRLIYVGDLERAYYDASALAKFEAAAAAGELTIVYQAAGVTIYRYEAEA